MKRRAIVGIAAVAAALGLVLSGCGSETTKTETASSEKTTKSKATSSAKAAPKSELVAPRDEDAEGANPNPELHPREQHPGGPGEPRRSRIAHNRSSYPRRLGARG